MRRGSSHAAPSQPLVVEVIRAPVGREVEPPREGLAVSGRGGVGNARHVYREVGVFDRVILHERGVIQSKKDEAATPVRMSFGRGGGGAPKMKKAKSTEFNLQELSSQEPEPVRHGRSRLFSFSRKRLSGAPPSPTSPNPATAPGGPKTPASPTSAVFTGSSPSNSETSIHSAPLTSPPAITLNPAPTARMTLPAQPPTAWSDTSPKSQRSSLPSPTTRARSASLPPRDTDAISFHSSSSRSRRRSSPPRSPPPTRPLPPLPSDDTLASPISPTSPLCSPPRSPTSVRFHIHPSRSVTDTSAHLRTSQQLVVVEEV